MRREPIVRSAIAVALTWTVIFGLLNRDTAWKLIQTGYTTILLTGGLLLAATSIGFLLALWLSSEEHESRINRLIPKPQRGLQASIGAVPLHTKPEKGWSQELNLSDPAASVAFAFKTLREREDLVPLELRSSPTYQDGIDLDAIEQHVLALPARYIALFDAILRVFMAHPTLLTTYEQEGHGRHNGEGGRTLLQHSLLVCQCALSMAPSWSYEGMRTVTKEGLPGDVVYQPRRKAQCGYASDPLVALIGLAHDIGKIQCYLWRDGEKEPYALAPNHDLVGARMLAIFPQTWAMSDEGDQTDPSEADPQVLITAVAFYHHPTEQPMDGGGIKAGASSPGKNRIILDLGGVQIRSDRQVALMELLIAADKQAGAIEHRSVQVPQGLQGNSAAPSPVPPPQARSASLHDAIWDAIEAVLIEPGRINAKQMRGMVTSASVGTRHNLPDWGGSVLILKEDDFVKAVISRADLPPEKRDFYLEEINAPSARGNIVNAATLLILNVLDKRVTLLTPPGQAKHSAETSLWKIAYHEAKNVYRDGDVSHGALPAIAAAPLFKWGSTIVCSVSTTLPSVAAGDAFHLVPVCFGNRLGNQGNVSKKSGRHDRSRKSLFDDEASPQGTEADATMAVARPARSGTDRVHNEAYVETFIDLLGAGLRQKTFTTQVDVEGRVVVQSLFEETSGVLGLRTNMAEVAGILLNDGDSRVSLEPAKDTSGRNDFRIILDAPWFHATVRQHEDKDKVGGDENPMTAFDEPAPPQDDPDADDNPPEAPEIPQDRDDDPPKQEAVPTQEFSEDSYVTFQKGVEAYLRQVGPQALAKKQDKNTLKVIDYAIKEPVDDLFQKMGTEEILIDFPSDEEDADMGIITSKAGVRMLRISPSWLDRRDLTPP